MNENMLKMIIAQQVILLKRIEKLEKSVSMVTVLRSDQARLDELKKEAMKIVDHISL